MLIRNIGLLLEAQNSEQLKWAIFLSQDDSTLESLDPTIHLHLCQEKIIMEKIRTFLF